jgi:hypothetical protein
LSIILNGEFDRVIAVDASAGAEGDIPIASLMMAVLTRSHAQFSWLSQQDIMYKILIAEAGGFKGLLICLY